MIASWPSITIQAPRAQATVTPPGSLIRRPNATSSSVARIVAHSALGSFTRSRARTQRRIGEAPSRASKDKIQRVRSARRQIAYYLSVFISVCSERQTHTQKATTILFRHDLLINKYPAASRAATPPPLCSNSAECVCLFGATAEIHFHFVRSNGARNAL